MASSATARRQHYMHSIYAPRTPLDTRFKPRNEKVSAVQYR
jgi:hypothetical protein